MTDWQPGTLFDDRLSGWASAITPRNIQNSVENCLRADMSFLMASTSQSKSKRTGFVKARVVRIPKSMIARVGAGFIVLVTGKILQSCIVLADDSRYLIVQWHPSAR